MKVYLYSQLFVLLLISDVAGDSVPGEVQSSIRGSVFLHIPDEEQPSLDEQVTKDMERLVMSVHTVCVSISSLLHMQG